MGDIVPFQREHTIVCKRCKSEQFTIIEGTDEETLFIICVDCDRQLLMDIKYKDRKGGEDGKR